MSGAKERQAWLKPSVAITLVAVSAFSLLAFLVLSAYAPDLRMESDGGTHALSNSAVGFAGLVRLLRYEGEPVVIDRGLAPNDHEKGSLLIVTPDAFGNPSRLVDVVHNREALVILPKWLVAQDPQSPGWVRKIGAAGGQTFAESTLKKLSPTSVVAQRLGTAPVTLKVPDNDEQDFDLPPRIGAIDSLQTISGKDWIPLITDNKGDAILAQLRGSETFVLADPDLMNTHGLADLATARAAVGIVEGLRVSDAAILFDVTLNGYGRSPSLLRAAFAPPFLGATICAIAAAFLMALHVMARFGAPLRAAGGFRSGKGMLVDNSAQLIHMMHREPNMAQRYAVTTRDMAARALGLPRGLSAADLDAALDRLTHRAGNAPALKRLFDDASRTETTTDMMDVATKLYGWRQRLTHERE